MRKKNAMLVKLQQQKKVEKNAIMCKMESNFVPGRPGTEDFVPGHMIRPLYRDKGTPGQENLFVPGQRENETSHPGLSRDVHPVETLVHT